MSRQGPGVSTEQAVAHIGPRVSERDQDDDSQDDLTPATYEVCFSVLEDVREVVVTVDSYSVGGTPSLMEFMLEGETVLIVPSETFISAQRIPEDSTKQA